MWLIENELLVTSSVLAILAELGQTNFEGSMQSLRYVF